jgi:aminopeptidase S
VVAAVLAGCVTEAPPDAIPPPDSPRPVASRSPAPPPTSTFPTPTSASGPTTAARLTADALADRIDPDALEGHLVALQAIADAHGGHRATGSTGMAASLTYAAQALRDAGYRVERHPFAVAGVEGTNLVAERPGSDPGVVMLGAHLDSVAVGPGINDNASGVAAVLAVGGALAELPVPERTIRLALWDAEEGGPFGSRAYVDGLTSLERDRIVAYLNLDMIGSPNAVRLVYAEADAADGSEAVTDAFAAYFDARGLPWEPIDLDGDSDHGPFVDAGIPTGGLFAGGIEPVTDAQAGRYGATADLPADACSHRPCDTADNVDRETLELMARAAASVLALLSTDG